MHRAAVEQALLPLHAQPSLRCPCTRPPQACGIGVGLQLLQPSAPQRRPVLADAAAMEGGQPRGLETSVSNLSLLTVGAAAGFVCCSTEFVPLAQQLCQQWQLTRQLR